MIVALLGEPVGTRERRQPRWLALADAAVACRDPRVTYLLGDVVACDPGLAVRLAKAFPPEAIAQLDALDAHRPRLVELVARLAGSDDARADVEREAALRAAVYANPADDAPRAVYADWLLERGDPLGELIALQLQPEHDRRRMEALVKAHAARIVGPMRQLFVRDSWTIERGFLATCRIRRGVVPQPDPAWATVREIDGAIPASDAHPMPVLRAARGIRPSELARLAALATPPPLEELGVSGCSRSVCDAIARLRLPELHTLILEAVDAHAISPTERWWHHFPLARLDVPAELADIAGFGALLSDRLRLVVLALADWRVMLRPGELIAHHTRGTGDVTGFVRALEQLPALTRISIATPASAWTADTRAAMAVALARHPGARIDIKGYK